MLTATAERIIRGLQGAGGQPFTIFVDRLLRALGTVYGIPPMEIVTTVRVNVADEGVDTEVLRGLPGDTSGLLGEPTIWQYKATAYSNIEWERLLDGDYLQNLICVGEAFRLAVADDMPSATLAKREAELWTAVKEWNPDAPQPRIVTASRLAELANRFPALVLASFYEEARSDLLHLTAWASSAEDPTPDFVPVSHWAGIERELAAHIDLSVLPPSAVRTVQGEAGVGKTRLVFETARRIPGAEALVVYTVAERALEVAQRALNDHETRLVLVADECDVRVRYQLKQLLNGRRERIRVIAIDNTLVRADAPDPELSLGKMPEASLDAVLATNFPLIDVTRRRAYADIAEGFPGLAAELCRYDAKIPAHGDVSAVISNFVDFYRIRLSENEREAMGALGLMMKLGYAGDVAAQFRSWCEYLGIDHDGVLRALYRVHDGPGFVGRTPRYLRVVPELIAKLAFSDGWRRWAEHDPTAFLNGIPTELLDEFINRFRVSASGEVRRVCADHFRAWADARVPSDLTDLAVVRRLESLADAYPTEYLPLLRRLLETATPAERLAVTGHGDGSGNWGPRRALVWLAERFAQLPDYWPDAERILAALASAESEPNIGNNATAIWAQGFRIILSGTATPFRERLARLRERLRDERPEVQEAARGILGAPLTARATRMVGPAVVAGRIPPAEWRPTSAAEEHECVADALALYAEALDWDVATRAAVIHELIHAFRSLMMTGHREQVRAILNGVALTDDERVALIDALDMVIQYDLTRSRRTPAAEADEADAATALADHVDSVGAPRTATENEQHMAHSDAVRGWREALAGRDLHSRVLSLVGKQRWGSTRIQNEEAWRRELEELAADVAHDGSTLDGELPWLISGAAHAAGEFGAALGRTDAAAAHFDRVMATAQTGAAGVFARGYANGLAVAHPTYHARLMRWIDARERDAPEVAADVAISIGPAAEPLSRVLRLFEDGRLPARYLYARNFPAGSDGEMRPAELTALEERLAPAAEGGDEMALRVGLENLALRLPYEVGATPDAILEHHPELRALAWRFLDAVPAGEAPPSHWWSSLVGHLSHFEPVRAARYLAGMLRTLSLMREDSLERALESLSVRQPAAVMNAIGEVMLDDAAGIRFFFGDYKTIFTALPDEVKRTWIERVGVEGARRIARHIQPPKLNDQGEPIVPSFTAWLLERFGDDDRTFREFVAGCHSWQSYSGDIAAQHEEEAALARLFLDYPLARIREWARIEERSAMAEAASERQRVAEQDLP